MAKDNIQPAPPGGVQLDLISLPDRPELVQAVSHPINYGRLAMRDQELVDQAASLFALGRGVRAVSRLLGIGSETARGIRRKLDESGRLKPFKTRMAGKIGEVMADSIDELHQSIIDGTFPKQSLPVAFGILADKKAALEGEPGLIVEHRQAADLSPRAISAGLASLIGEGPVVDVDPEPAEDQADRDHDRDYDGRESTATGENAGVLRPDHLISNQAKLDPGADDQVPAGADRPTAPAAAPAGETPGGGGRRRQPRAG